MDPNKTIMIGPPGTGKTTAATGFAYDRYKQLGDRIGYFTFTRRAAREARNRMRKWLGNEHLQLDHFQTIHSLCFNQLGLSKSRVMDLDSFAQYARLRISKKMVSCFDVNKPYLGQTEDDRYIFLIGWAKAKCLSKNEAIIEIGPGTNRVRLREIWDLMDQFKQERSLIDFDDMLTLFLEWDNVPELHTIIIDEGQDTSKKQRLVVAKIRERNPDAKILWAADGDQTIYEWAGSGVGIQESIENSWSWWPLSKSYRVPQPVYDLAMKVIGRCKYRYPISWQPADHEGSVKRIMRMDQVKHLDNLIILVRNYCYLYPYVRWLKYNKLEYRMLNDKKESNIRIGTIHESKGLEADNVIIDLNMTLKSWKALPTDEEKRVWYTAITRARKNLYIMLQSAKCNADILLR